MLTIQRYTLLWTSNSLTEFMCGIIFLSACLWQLTALFASKSNLPPAVQRWLDGMMATGGLGSQLHLLSWLYLTRGLFFHSVHRQEGSLSYVAPPIVLNLSSCHCPHSSLQRKSPASESNRPSALNKGHLISWSTGRKSLGPCQVIFFQKHYRWHGLMGLLDTTTILCEWIVCNHHVVLRYSCKDKSSLPMDFANFCRLCNIVCPLCWKTCQFIHCSWRCHCFA